MTTDRDPVVGGVLDLLPVPRPTERFWAELSARLHEEAEAPVLRIVDDPERPEVVTLDRHRMPAGRAAAPFRRRRIAAGLLAAAVAAGAVLLVGALQGGPGRDGVEVVPPRGGSSSLDATTTIPGWPAARQALAWISAVASGDADAAWVLVGSQSRESIGGRSSFDRLMASDLREGWGAWDQDGVAISAAVLGDEADPQAWAVMLHGTILQEGPAAFRAAVLLVREEADELVVEPFVPGAALDLIELPATGDRPPALPEDGIVPIHVDADAAAFVVALDGAAVGDAALVRDGSGAVRGLRVPAVEPGDHTVTVAVATASGALAADAKPFTVADG